jgi:hypothetical protein
MDVQEDGHTELMFDLTWLGRVDGQDIDMFVFKIKTSLVQFFDRLYVKFIFRFNVFVAVAC